MHDAIPPTVSADHSPAPLEGTEGALAVGTRLREFEILSVVGQGGFGVVYLAQDHTLGRRVAIKEFMPTALAVRNADGSVGVRSGEREPFELGLRSFVNEARLLAKFDLASVVRVYQFWEDRGTAYIVMPFYHGVTLADWIAAKARREPLPCDDEIWLLRHLIEPLMGALEKLHAVQCYHRDIAPDNILLLEGSWQPVLLDFGAARNVIGSATRKLTAFVKPGYAPIEQYGERGESEAPQGAWTDIYALSGVLYHLIAGAPPPAAPTRLLRDPLTPLVTLARGRYTETLLSAIDAGLAIRPEHRPQSVEIWRLLMGGQGADSRDGAGAGFRLALVDLEPAGPAEADPHGPVSSASSPAGSNLDFSVGDSLASAMPADGVTGMDTAPEAIPLSGAHVDEDTFARGSDVPRSLYSDDAPSATGIRRAHVDRQAPAATPGARAAFERMAGQDEPVPDLQLVAPARRLGLRRLLGGVGLLAAFLSGAAIWLHGPPDLFGSSAGERRRDAPVPGIEAAASRPASTGAEISPTASAGEGAAPVSDPVWCAGLLRRASSGAAVQELELDRYERECIQ
jgi:serine/threonine protein kinase